MTAPARSIQADALLAIAKNRWTDLVDSVSEISNSLIAAVGEESFNRLAPTQLRLQAEFKDALAQLISAASRPRIVLATTGTTSSGKSTLANFLVGELLLPKAVQEMSAGVVSIHHSDDDRKLIIHPTRGATWPTGKWEGISAESVRSRLTSTMQSYWEKLGDGVPAGASQLEPPRIEVIWPTRIGKEPGKFGMPLNTDLTLVDLPGLKFVNDELNGGVVREQTKKALCLVAYNSFETDPKKQEALLTQIVDQVKMLGGSPARMLFILNRIDAFQTDEDPQASESAFCDRITRQVRSRISEALTEYADVASSIEPIPLSSEPALYAELARNSEGDAQADILAKLEDDYKNLFSRSELNQLPRDPRDWSEEQRSWFIEGARRRARASDFEDRLGAHIATHLPEILLHDLVEDLYHASHACLQGLGALIHAYDLNEIDQLEKEKARLNELFEQVNELRKTALDCLRPLKEIDGGDDLLGSLRAAIAETERALGLNDGDAGSGVLAPLSHALHDAVQLPIQRLLDFAYKSAMGGEVVEDTAIDSCPSSPALYSAIDQLRASPYSGAMKEGGRFEDGPQANAVRSALAEFSRQLSKVATELIASEAKVQSSRMQEALKRAGEGLIDQLVERATPILQQSGYGAMRNVFSGKITLAPPRLPPVKFEEKIERWTVIEKSNVEESYYADKRVWWTLWIKKKRVRKTRTVVKTTKKNGIELAALGDLLDGFGGGGNIDSLERVFTNWLADGVVGFESTLEQRLNNGFAKYRAAFEERAAELEDSTKQRISDVTAYREHLARDSTAADSNRNWRAYV